MKRLFFTAAAFLFAGLALPAQDFDKAWSASEYAAKFGNDLYYGAVRPVWTDGDTFVFETNEPSGKVRTLAKEETDERRPACQHEQDLR